MKGKQLKYKQHDYRYERYNLIIHISLVSNLINNMNGKPLKQVAECQTQFKIFNVKFQFV